MKYQQIISTLLTLGLTTFANAGEFSIASVTDTQTMMVGSSIAGSNAYDASDILAVASDVIVDNREDQQYGNYDSRFQRHVGLGFGLSKSNGNPHNGECNGNGNENYGNASIHCGDPSPSD